MKTFTELRTKERTGVETQLVSGLVLSLGLALGGLYFTAMALFLLQGPATQRGIAQLRTSIPKYGWTATGGSAEYDGANDVVYDRQGNMYFVGQFMGTIDFNRTDGVDEHTSNGSWDYFLTKYSTDGSYDWTITLGGDGFEAGRTVTVDRDGSIIIGGDFTGPNFEPGYVVDFDPSEGIDHHTTAGYTDIFTTKINADGTYAWTNTVGGGSYEAPSAVITDRNGQVGVTGYFMNTVDFDPGIGTDYRSGDPVYGDVFVTWYDPSGKYVTTRNFGAGSADKGYDLDIDSTGNWFVSGTYSRTIFLEGLGSFTAMENIDQFVLKITSEKTYAWFYAPGGAGNNWALGVAADNRGNVYATGGFHAPGMDFDPGPGVDWHDTHGTPYDYDIYLTKLTDNGGYLWTKTIGGYSGGGVAELGRSVKIDPVGNPVITGRYHSQMDFDPGPGEDVRTPVPPNGDATIFVAKYTASGLYTWAATYGSIGWDESQDLDVNASGVVTVGGYGSPTDFDPTEAVDMHPWEGSSDFFLQRLVDPVPSPTNTPQ